MFTAGCCILCLSLRNWCADMLKAKVFDMVVRRSAKGF